jgi:hypothetical protein
MNSENTSSTIKQIMGQAISSQARRFTYCLIYEEKCETKVGTAVALKLGTRFFLATAGHIIEKARSIKVLMHDQVRHYVSDFAAKDYDREFDVGLLEIADSESDPFEFMPQNFLCRTINDEQEMPVLVIGFASQFCKPIKTIDLTPESSSRVVRCDTLTFNTVVLPRSEWPSEGLPDEDGIHKKLVDGHDMLLDFEPEPEVIPFTANSTGTENPAVECQTLNPHGMSGGGIWLAQIREGPEKLNSPDARLIGLQTGWHPSKNLLHGICIGVWLDFVSDRYRDLR